MTTFHCSCNRMHCNCVHIHAYLLVRTQGNATWPYTTPPIFPQVQPLSTVCATLAADMGTSPELVLLSHRNSTLSPTETPESLGLTTADIIGRVWLGVGLANFTGWVWFGVGLALTANFTGWIGVLWVGPYAQLGTSQSLQLDGCGLGLGFTSSVGFHSSCGWMGVVWGWVSFRLHYRL